MSHLQAPHPGGGGEVGFVPAWIFDSGQLVGISAVTDLSPEGQDLKWQLQQRRHLHYQRQERKMQSVGAEVPCHAFGHADKATWTGAPATSWPA